MVRPPDTPPLHGLLVADFSRVLSGPLATMILGDLGADVIKVEHPNGGDDTRSWGPPFAPDGEATYFLSVNRNKRSVTLDLGNPSDRAMAIKLAQRADVLVENFRPGVLDRFGLSYEDVYATNRGIIYASITGFGSDTESSGLAGYDLLVQAMSGLMDITGEPGGEPTKVGVAVIDVMAGLYLASGILAALAARSRSGKGEQLEISLFDTALAGLVNQVSAVIAGDETPQRMGNEHPSIVPYRTFAAGDGSFVLAVGNDQQFVDLCKVINRPELASDERFATNAARVVNRNALSEVLDQVFSQAPVAYWLALFADVGVPAGPINDIASAVEFADRIGADPMLVTVRPDGEEVRTLKSPLRFFRAGDIARHRPPPRLGEHDAEIRRWLGNESAN